MSVVVTPSARETFTPHELTAAYEDFRERGPQILNSETGLRASAYRIGERILIAYQESDKDVVILTHPTLAIDSLRVKVVYLWGEGKGNSPEVDSNSS